MKWIGALFSILFLMTSCLPHLVAQRQLAGATEYDEVRAACLALSGQPGVQDLLATIRKDIKKLLKLANSKDPEKNKDKAKALGAKIQSELKKLNALIDSRYSEPRFFEKLIWSIQDCDQDEGASDRTEKRGWQILDTEIEEAFWAGRQMNGGDVNLVVSGPRTMEWSRKVSLLDLCELDGTLAIKTKIVFEKGERRKSVDVHLITMDEGEE